AQANLDPLDIDVAGRCVSDAQRRYLEGFEEDQFALSDDKPSRPYCVANLRDARLDLASLAGAKLTSALLARANMEAATFDEASMMRAELVGSNLAGTSFRSAQMVLADLSRVKSQ